MLRPALVLMSLALAITLTSCEYGEPSRVEAPTDTAKSAISFELAGAGDAALIVPVYVNGEGPHEFVFDTGATMTCVNEELADRLGLPERTGQVGVGVGVGGSGNVRMVAIDSLRVGQTKAFDLAACTLDLTGLEQAGLRVDGLLGLNFLKSFRVVLDFGDNSLHLLAL